MAKARILVVDDDADFSSIIKTNLESHGYEADICADPKLCEQRLRDFKADLLILDLMMGGRMEGALLARRLKGEDGAFRQLPILLLTGVRQQTGFFWLGDPRHPTHLPVNEVMEKPVKPAELAQHVQALLGEKAAAPEEMKRTLLVIDDNPALRAACQEVFRRQPEYVVLAAPDGPTGLEMLARHEPDLLLVDLGLPGMDGVEVIRRVQKDVPRLPIIGITGDGVAAAAAERRLARRIHWLPKPFTPGELREAVRQALEDPLSGPEQPS